MTLPSIKRLAARLIASLPGRSNDQRRKRILSNLDWVIQMLHQVHEDTPEASARWWVSVKEAVLNEPRTTTGRTGQTKTRQ